MLPAPRRRVVVEQEEEEYVRFGRQLRGPEAAEALAAFAEKRTPDFSRF